MVTGTENIVMTHVTVAGLSVALINYLKASKYFPWITREKTNVMRAAAIVTSAIGTVGIHYTWHPESRQLVFAIPTLAGALGLGISWLKSFVMQELVYQSTRGNGAAAFVPGQFASGTGTGGVIPGASAPPKA